MGIPSQATGGPPVEPPAAAEIELKLRGAPAALKSLFAGSAINARATGRGSSRRLENVYYDTADQRLRAKGLAFRVRKDGRKYQQTLKSNDAGGLVAYRGEWQTPLASATPDLALLPLEASEVLHGLLEADELHSLFTTRVRRQTRRLATGANGAGGLVEAALDLGEIEAGGRRQQIAEIELELLDGSPASLYDLALELDAETPLQVEMRSKPARGYALAASEPPAWYKAPPLALKPRTTVDDALQAILRTCLHHWCINEAAALDGRDPEGVHQMRVALRRLRSAVSVFGRLIAPERRRWLEEGAGYVIGSLGPARDWDVFCSESLAPVLAARPGDRHLAALRDAAEDERRRGYETARTRIGAPAYTRFLLELGRWIEAGGWREQPTGRGAAWFGRPIVEFADHRLAKRHKQALRLGRRFAELTPAQRHRVRIALKKLRYTAEFFQGLYGKKRTKAYLAAVKQLQDALGHLNDVAVAETLTAGLIERAGTAAPALAQGAGMVAGWLARGVAEIEPQTRAGWERFVERKPFWHVDSTLS